MSKNDPARDKYDAAIEYLEVNPHQIRNAWHQPSCHPGGCLFQYLGDHRKHYPDPEGGGTECGCITQVVDGGGVAATVELTIAIRADERLPARVEDVELHHLPLFAAWQRDVDLMGVR